MEEAQKELEEKEITAAAGGGAVEVTVSNTSEKCRPGVIHTEKRLSLIHI